MPLRSPYDATAERYNSISTVSKQIHVRKMQYIHGRGVWVDRKVEDGGFWGDLEVGGSFRWWQKGRDRFSKLTSQKLNYRKVISLQTYPFTSILAPALKIHLLRNGFPKRVQKHIGGRGGYVPSLIPRLLLPCTVLVDWFIVKLTVLCICLLNVQYTKCMRSKEDLCAGIMLGYSHLFSNWRWLFPSDIPSAGYTSKLGRLQPRDSKSIGPPLKLYDYWTHS